jgi:hypothetical protein
MCVSFKHCVLSGRGLCIGLITLPENSHRVCCDWVRSWILDHEGFLITRGCYPMGKMPNTTYFINQCPSPCTRKKPIFGNWVFRTSHEKYVVRLCLIERVILIPLSGILTIRQSQDTHSELFQGYWNWMLFISFSFNGAKITKLLHAHFKFYGLLFNFIFHFDW